MVSRFSIDDTEEGFALGFVFDIVLRGAIETPMETKPMNLKQTPSQTVGPYFAYALTAEQYGYPLTSVAGGALAGAETEGQRIRIVGRVLDGEGKPVDDAMIEIWQADARGRYAHPADPRGSNTAFKGFGRMGTGTDPENRFIFDTIKPGSVDGKQAPHIGVIVTMRGLLVHAFTRIYFSDEAAANAKRPGARLSPGGQALDTGSGAQRGRRQHRLPLRYSHAGTEGDGVLRRLSRAARPMSSNDQRGGA